MDGRDPAPHENRKSRIQKGFTLLELMVTLAILAVVLTSIYAILMDTLRTKNALDEVMMPEQFSTPILGMMRRDVEMAFWPLEVEGTWFKGEDSLGWGLEADSITFIASRQGLFTETNSPGFIEVGYFVEEALPQRGSFRLYRRESVSSGEGVGGGGRGVLLCDRVKALKFEYLDEQRNWVHEWPPYGEAGLPRAVRVELSLEVAESEAAGRESEPYKFSETIVIIQSEGTREQGTSQ